MKVFTSAWNLIDFEELFQGDLQISPDSKVGGAAIASFQSALGKIDIITHADAPYDTMFFMGNNVIKRAVQKELGWRKDRGGKAFLKASGTNTVYQAAAIEISEYFIEERQSSGKINGIALDAGRLIGI